MLIVGFIPSIRYVFARNALYITRDIENLFFFVIIAKLLLWVCALQERPCFEVNIRIHARRISS